MKPQTRRMQDVLRLADALSRVYVLNYFQPLLILRIFCMRGVAPPLKHNLLESWQHNSHISNIKYLTF
nr:hypothetical protein [Escherichia coli]